MEGRQNPVPARRLRDHHAARFLTEGQWSACATFSGASPQDLILDQVRWWAQQYDLDVIALERCGIPPYDILLRMPDVVPAEHHFFQVTAIDPDHVRRWGVARVHDVTHIIDGTDETVQVVWLTTEQLDWETLPAGARSSGRMPARKAGVTIRLAPTSCAGTPQAHRRTW